MPTQPAKCHKKSLGDAESYSWRAHGLSGGKSHSCRARTLQEGCWMSGRRRRIVIVSNRGNSHAVALTAHKLIRKLFAARSCHKQHTLKQSHIRCTDLFTNCILIFSRSMSYLTQSRLQPTVVHRKRALTRPFAQNQTRTAG
jgi:hypothetical protein